MKNLTSCTVIILCCSQTSIGLKHANLLRRFVTWWQRWDRLIEKNLTGINLLRRGSIWYCKEHLEIKFVEAVVLAWKWHWFIWVLRQSIDGWRGTVLQWRSLSTIIGHEEKQLERGGIPTSWKRTTQSASSLVSKLVCWIVPKVAGWEVVSASDDRSAIGSEWSANVIDGIDEFHTTTRSAASRTFGLDDVLQTTRADGDVTSYPLYGKCRVLYGFAV